MLAALYWKHPNIEGISAKWLDGKIVIRKWPAAAGAQPTEAQLAAYIPEYQAHLAAEGYKSKRDADARQENMAEILRILIDKIDNAPGADAKYEALKTKLNAIESKHPSP